MLGALLGTEGEHGECHLLLPRQDLLPLPGLPGEPPAPRPML